MECRSESAIAKQAQLEAKKEVLASNNPLSGSRGAQKPGTGSFGGSGHFAETLNIRYSS